MADHEFSSKENQCHQSSETDKQIKEESITNISKTDSTHSLEKSPQSQNSDIKFEEINSQHNKPEAHSVLKEDKINEATDPKSKPSDLICTITSDSVEEQPNGAGNQTKNATVIVSEEPIIIDNNQPNQVAEKNQELPTALNENENHSLERSEGNNMIKENKSEVEKEIQPAKEEEKKVDVEANYKLLLEAKDIANQIFKKNTTDGLNAYLDINKDIDYYMSFCKDHSTAVFKNLVQLKKIIISNIANCYGLLNNYKEAIRLDETILVHFDSRFEKSYGRLIKNYIRIGEVDRAFKCKETAVKYFGQNANFNEVFGQVFEELERADKERNKTFSKLAKKSVKSLDPQVPKPKKRNPKTKQISRKNSFFDKILIGATMLITSSVGLFLLYRFRRRFSYN